jgi:hypothetical protein
MQLITALSAVMQCNFVFFFCWPQCKGIGKKVDYLLHPHKIQKNYNIRPYMVQPQSEKAYNLPSSAHYKWLFY